MLRVFFAVSLILLVACTGQKKYSIDETFTPAQRDTLLADMITYIYVLPKYATSETRFEKRFRSYYVGNLSKFSFEKHFMTSDSIHYFYLIRPARDPVNNQRGVGGKFRLNDRNEIVAFEEIFNTPPAAFKILQERGDRLFKEMIRKRHVNDYLHHPDYVEWPDETTYYDTIRHQWETRL